MLESTGDYLSKRAKELGLERQDVLERIQAILDDQFPNLTRAISLNNQVLKIITPSSAVASELRLRQVKLLAEFRRVSAISNLNIQIRGL